MRLRVPGSAAVHGLAWVGLCHVLLGQDMLRLENLDDDPEKEIVIENSFCRLALKASAGATGISMKPKPTGTEMVIPRGGTGLFADAIWQQGMGGDWQSAYTFTIDSNTAEEAKVTFSKRGQTGDILQWVTITRSITMRADSPVLDVSVRIENEEASMLPFKLGLWTHHQIGAANQDNTYFLPTTQGVRRFVVTGTSSTQEYWSYDVTQGWIAALAEDGTGLAFKMDYGRLMCFYQWLKGSMQTLEWLYRSAEIPNGQAFETRYQVIPFHGLSSVDGVGDGVVGAIVYDQYPQPGKKATARALFTGAGGKVDLSMDWQRLPEEARRPIRTTAVEVAPGKVAAAEFDLEPPTEGTYVIRVGMSRAARPIGTLERLLELGKPSGRYVMAAEGPRLGRDDERYATSLERPQAPAKGKTPEKKLDIKDVPPDVPYQIGVFSKHVPWARPYHMGKTKAFLATQAQVARDVIEVAQRLDLDFKTTTFGIGSWKLPGDLVKDWSEAAAMAHMRKILQDDPLDVIVLRAPWSAFDQEVQNLIRQRVESGVGLVYVSYSEQDKDEALLKLVSQGPANPGAEWGKRDAEWVPIADHFICGPLPYPRIKSPAYSYDQTSGTPLLAWKVGEKTLPMVVASECGKGRVVCVNYNPIWFSARMNMFTPQYPYMRPFEHLKLPDYEPDWPRFHRHEYAYALLARCMLWAGRREPGLRVQKAQPMLDADKGTLNLTLRNGADAVTLQCRLSLRDNWSRLLAQTTSDIAIGKGDQAIAVPFDASVLRPGINFVEFQLLHASGVVEFGAADLDRPQVTLSISVTKDPVYEGEEAAARLAIQDPLPEAARAILTVEDHHRRVLYEQPVTWDGKVAEIPLHFENLTTPDYWVRAAIVQEGRALAEKDCRALRQMPVVFDDWLLGVETYGGNTTFYSDDYHRVFRQHGYRLAHTSVRYAHSICSMRSEGLMAGDITGWMDGWAMPDYQEVKQSYAKTNDPKWLERNPCIHDPAFRDKMAKRMRQYAPILKAYGIWDHTIIDEFSITHFGDAFDFCFSPHCLKRFRDWIQTQYKGLPELNDAFGSNFTSWDEVRPATFREAQERGKYAGWADHRRFMELSVYGYFQWVRDELRQIDPKARISLSGTQIPHPYNGHDVWLRCKTFDGLWSYPAHDQGSMHREWGRMLKPGWYEFPWRGYASRGPVVDQWYWESALNQSTGAAYWWFLNVLNPDWRLSETGQWTDRATRDLREGFGQLILGCELQVSPIALHYSQASTRGSYARRALPTWAGSRESWSRLLLGLGHQHTFLSYEQLETGKLSFPDTRVLILPYSICLSDAEAEAIRKFASDGGTVIADLQTGVMDEHCRERNGGALDPVFGIRRMDTKVGVVSGEGSYSPPPEWKSPPGRLGVPLAEPSLVLDGGQALVAGAGAPGMIRHRFGKGMAYYLNFPVAKLGLLSGRGEHEPLMRAVQAILEEAGARPPIPVERLDGKPLLDIDVYAYRSGEQQYLGLLPRQTEAEGEKVSVRVRLAVAREVRELRSGRSRDRTDSFVVELQRPFTQFFSLLTSPTAALDAQVTPAVKQGEKAHISFSVRTEHGAAGMRVVRLVIQDPAGEPVFRFERNLRTENGTGEVDLFVALNDPVGDYQVTLRDIASGLARDLVYRVVRSERLVPVIQADDPTVLRP